MHTNQTYNSLIIEEVDKLPFPPEIKENISKLDWSKQLWNSFGLPSFQNSFCVTNGQLYFEGNGSLNSKLEKSSFTGESLITTVIVNPNDCRLVYFLSFNAIFCKGILCESELLDFKTEPFEQYNIGFVQFRNNLDRAQRIRKSWWYKWLYLPYFNTIKWTTIGIVFVVEFILKMFCWVVDKFLPIKP